MWDTWDGQTPLSSHQAETPPQLLRCRSPVGGAPEPLCSSPGDRRLFLPVQKSKDVQEPRKVQVGAEPKLLGESCSSCRTPQTSSRPHCSSSLQPGRWSSRTVNWSRWTCRISATRPAAAARTRRRGRTPAVQVLLSMRTGTHTWGSSNSSQTAGGSSRILRV